MKAICLLVELLSSLQLEGQLELVLHLDIASAIATVILIGLIGILRGVGTSKL
jgi:hypothetical protein